MDSMSNRRDQAEMSSCVPRPGGGVGLEPPVTDVPMVGVAKGPDRDAGNETFYLPEKPAV